MFLEMSMAEYVQRVVGWWYVQRGWGMTRGWVCPDGGVMPMGWIYHRTLGTRPLTILIPSGGQTIYIRLASRWYASYWNVFL